MEASQKIAGVLAFGLVITMVGEGTPHKLVVIYALYLPHITQTGFPVWILY